MATHPAHHVLDPDLAAIDAFAANPVQPAEAAGRAARALYDDIVWRLAKADLPVAVRERVRGIERRAADLVIDFVRRGLPPRYFWPDFAVLAHELDAAATTAPERPDEAATVRALLAELRRDVAAAGFPPAIRGRLHGALAALAAGLEAFDAGDLRALADRARGAVQVAVDALDRLASGEREARFHRLTAAALGTDPGPAARAAIGSRLAALQGAWEADGELPDADLDGLEAWLAEERGGDPARPTTSRVPGLASAARRLDQAANRVATAPLPPFVAHAATEIVAHLRHQVAERAAGRLTAAAFEATLTGGLEAVESCLAFAREVGAERDIAARRVEGLARRAQDAALPPILAGPVEDELERLRALMNDLAAGSGAALDFHQAFEAAVDRVERLLAWRSAL